LLIAILLPGAFGLFIHNASPTVSFEDTGGLTAMANPEFLSPFEKEHLRFPGGRVG